MKQKYALTILFALIIASGLTSIGCYQATERIVAEDMECALTKALAEQQSDAITPDTIRTVYGVEAEVTELHGSKFVIVT